MLILKLLLILIFLVLAAIHFYWAFGGKWAFNDALPTNDQGNPVLKVRPIDSIIVGCGLLFFALFYFLKIGLVEFTLPNLVVTILNWIIPSIFLLRAIGEFRYVGFFKKTKETPFGKLDTQLFSPLCLLMSVLGFLISIAH